MRSARTTACVGDVCLPSSWAASRRAGRRQGAAEQRHLPAGVAHLRAQVVPVQLQQPLADHQAQPQEQGQFGVAQVLVQALGHLDVGLLDHVRGVEAGLEARVETYLHHAAQPVAVPGEEGLQGRPAAGAGPLDPVHRLGQVVVHQGPHTLLPPRPGQFWTGGDGFFSRSDLS
jgi:hypothetical protein